MTLKCKRFCIRMVKQEPAQSSTKDNAIVKDHVRVSFLLAQNKHLPRVSKV